MATEKVRFTLSHPCPICGGYDGLPRGRGVRCYGFFSEEQKWAYCTREEYAGSVQQNRGGGFSHRLQGDCRCGRVHGDRVPTRTPSSSLRPRANGNGTYALEIWKRTKPASGTIVETYMRTRGITMPAPTSLRFTHSLKHPGGLWLPAMVAGITVWPGMAVTAIHRTWLRTDGSGKAELEGAKMMLGNVKGGAVRFAQPGEMLVIGEGIETCLSVMEATGLPTWACLSASNYQSLALPPLPLASRVLIAADGDRTGLHTAHRARDLWRREGRNVFVANPGQGRDFNDELLEVPA